MNLSQEIKQYYFNHFDELTQDKQFHFASRIGAWEGDLQAIDKLRELKTFILPDPSPEKLKKNLQQIISAEPTTRINAFQLRKPFFQKYPLLYGAHASLFRVRHLKSVYGIDAKDVFFECLNKQALDDLALELLDDAAAVRTLSTFAINFLFLYKFILLDQKNFVKPERFLKIGQGYNLDEKRNAQLLIYLFTHCIIGETNFYQQNIRRECHGSYIRMLKILDSLITERFEDINLDNKLEFLVACRICNIDSALFARVYAECNQSLSQKGHFLVDQHNRNKQRDREDFVRSEHRNVLYIMSFSSYRPHSTLVI